MRKRFDDLFAALMLIAAVAVILAGGWVLSHSIERANAEPTPTPVAVIHIELPQATPDPLPAPTPMPTEELDPYNPAIPLSAELQEALREACAEYSVPLTLALGLIEVESRFRVDAVSREGCYGLCQLNPRFFPDKLSPADNIRSGIEHLGNLLGQYGDTAAALCAYNAGSDTGARGYANAVLEAAERRAAKDRNGERPNAFQMTLFHGAEEAQG